MLPVCFKLDDFTCEHNRQLSSESVFLNLNVVEFEGKTEREAGVLLKLSHCK